MPVGAAAEGIHLVYGMDIMEEAAIVGPVSKTLFTKYFLFGGWSGSGGGGGGGGGGGDGGGGGTS